MMNDYDDGLDTCEMCGNDIERGKELCRLCREQGEIDETFNDSNWRPE